MRCRKYLDKMNAKYYKTKINAQVKADHSGELPESLWLTIDNYARALEYRDQLKQAIGTEFVIREVGSQGQVTTKVNPLVPILYQQDTLILNYSKALGGTAAKAAKRTDDSSQDPEGGQMAKFLETLNS